MPKGSQPVEGVALFDGGPEVYGFHSLEAMQALIEKRAGGEAGVRAITAYAQDGVWEAMEHGVWSHDLFDAALAACTLVKEGDVRANCQAISPWDQFGCPTAFHVEHADGVRNTHILLQGHIEDVAVAIRDRNGRTYANRWEFGDADVFYAHFARLNALIQEMFLTGRSPVPIERTLLTTLTIAACMQALQMPGIRIETPQLNLPYNTISCDTPRASISNSIS